MTGCPLSSPETFGICSTEPKLIRSLEPIKKKSGSKPYVRTGRLQPRSGLFGRLKILSLARYWAIPGDGR